MLQAMRVSPNLECEVSPTQALKGAQFVIHILRVPILPGCCCREVEADFLAQAPADKRNEQGKLFCFAGTTRVAIGLYKGACTLRVQVIARGGLTKFPGRPGHFLHEEIRMGVIPVDDRCNHAIPDKQVPAVVISMDGAACQSCGLLQQGSVPCVKFRIDQRLGVFQAWQMGSFGQVPLWLAGSSRVSQHGTMQPCQQFSRSITLNWLFTVQRSALNKRKEGNGPPVIEEERRPIDRSERRDDNREQGTEGEHECMSPTELGERTLAWADAHDERTIIRSGKPDLAFLTAGKPASWKEGEMVPLGDNCTEGRSHHSWVCSFLASRQPSVFPWQPPQRQSHDYPTRSQVCHCAG